MAPDQDDAFEAAFARAEPIPGWLTREQAAALFDAAAAVAEGGRVVELGTHHGRSAVVLASALRRDARLVAVDPFPEDWRYGGVGTEQECRRHLVESGVGDRVDLRVATSRAVRASWQGALDLVYVDGKHDYWTVRDDLGWADLVVPGGWVMVHDAFSSFGVTTALLHVLTGSRSLRYAGRVGSLARLQVAAPSPADRLRLLAQLPWWARNLVVKVLLRLRWWPLVRLLGHHDTADPY